MDVGDRALSGQPEPILFHIFPAEDEDREIEWVAQGVFGKGSIKIGNEEVPFQELLSHASKSVPAGQSVQVIQMVVKFKTSSV